VFAAVGLALSVIGVYGVVAYRVRQREREFGIRLALGAAPHRVARSVVRTGAVYAVAGLLIGIPAAFMLARLMQSVVFGITAHDPLTFVAVPASIVAVTLLACCVPARRAARLDPTTTTRGD
jgi:ABC-type antimicrobial peptide transport system permease subunit